MIVRRIIQDPRELSALTPEWLDLLKRSQLDELALTPTWVTTWWEIFGSIGGAQLRAVAFRRNGVLIGLAPLFRRRRLHGGLVPVWRLELCCTGEDREEEVCSPYVGILAERGTEAEVAASFVTALAAGELGAWDELCLTSLLESDSLLAPLEAELRRARMWPAIDPINSSSYIRLPATWDAYLESLPSQRRYFVRRTLRDLEAWLKPDGGERHVTGAADLAHGQAVLYELHKQRWRAEGRDGVFVTPRFRRFHEAIMRAFVDGHEAELELCWVEQKGQPAAVLYNIVYNGRVYFYQSGRSLDVPKSVRPGIGAHLLAIRRHIELKRREYDFLEGAQMYKSQLASEERRIVALRARSPELRSRALEAARKSLLVAKHYGRELVARIKRKTSAV